jgi:hypothetical protein
VRWGKKEEREKREGGKNTAYNSGTGQQNIYMVTDKKNTRHCNRANTKQASYLPAEPKQKGHLPAAARVLFRPASFRGVGSTVFTVSAEKKTTGTRAQDEKTASGGWRLCQPFGGLCASCPLLFVFVYL